MALAFLTTVEIFKEDGLHSSLCFCQHSCANSWLQGNFSQGSLHYLF